METYNEKLDSSKSSKDSTCNVTYAQVLSKAPANTNDVSNNNPTELPEVMNGNENVSINPDVQDSAINELSEKSFDSSLVELSQSDSYEDAEDSQTVNSTSTVKSSDFVQNTTEESSSVINADSNESKPSNYNDSQSSGKFYFSSYAYECMKM